MHVSILRLLSMSADMDFMAMKGFETCLDFGKGIMFRASSRLTSLWLNTTTVSGSDNKKMQDVLAIVCKAWMRGHIFGVFIAILYAGHDLDKMHIQWFLFWHGRLVIMVELHIHIKKNVVICLVQWNGGTVARSLRVFFFFGFGVGLSLHSAGL